MKKLTFLLASVAAGVSLVGATFAAYAISDEADPLGIKISPTEIHESTDGFSTMVLEWGDKASFTNISNLALDTPQTVSLQVKSTVTLAGSDTTVGGNLSIKLIDYTESHVQGAPQLVDNLEVHVYKGSVAEANEIDTLELGTVKEANSNIATAADGTPTTIYFKVGFKSGVSAAQYNQMQNDVVYLFADWGKPTGITEVSTQRIYFKSTGAVPYAYAFKETTSGINKNANWPGVAMEVYNTNEKVYYTDLEIGKFDKVIFSYNGVDQTDDLDVPESTSDLVLYNGTAWAKNTYSKDVVDPEYYLVGTINGWDTVEAYKLTDPTDGVYSIEIENVPADFEYKIKEVTTNTWYSYSSTDGEAINCSWGTPGDSILIRFSPTKGLEQGTAYITNVVANA